MFSIHKFHSRTGRIGQPLEYPYPVFQNEGIRHRYGATSMIAGKPGSYKSVLALNMLSRWVASGYTAMYFSADSDERTVASRLASIGTGIPWSQVDADFERGKYGPYLDLLGRFRHVRFEYRTFEMEQIIDRLDTFEQLGAYPDLVFLDNLINFAPSTDDWGYMRDMTNALDQIAREKMTHIVILHHASEGTGQASDPVPRSAIQGKITQIPRLVLTTAAGQDGGCLVSCVKNTNGPAYPDAQRWMRFDIQDNLRAIDNYEELLA